MRAIRFLLSGLLLLVASWFFVSAANAPSDSTTIILLRHAEKDTVGDDPVLTVKGAHRAAGLSSVFPDITPDEFYSTNFVRTRETVAPWTKQTNKEINFYEPVKLPELADKLKKEIGKTIVVVGHSNTVPPLVNLILGADKYKNLADTEYSKIFILTIKKGTVKDKVIHY